MIHSPHKSAVNPKHPFNLRGVLELEFAVDVPTVSNRPPIPDTAVDGRAIGPEPGSGFDLLEQEPSGAQTVWCGSSEYIPGEFPRSLLLGHHEGHIAEEGFIQLHNALQDVRFLGKMGTESAIPPPHRIIRERGDGSCLEDGLLDRPAPEEHPELFVRELHVREPRMGQE